MVVMFGFTSALAEWTGTSLSFRWGDGNNYDKSVEVEK